MVVVLGTKLQPPGILRHGAAVLSVIVLKEIGQPQSAIKVFLHPRCNLFAAEQCVVVIRDAVRGEGPEKSPQPERPRRGGLLFDRQGNPKGRVIAIRICGESLAEPTCASEDIDNRDRFILFGCWQRLIPIGSIPGAGLSLFRPVFSGDPVA